MSAFILGKVHIDAMLTAALGHGARDDQLYWYTPKGGGRRVDHETVDQVGAMLVEENVKSIRARYPDVEEDLEAAPGPIENGFAVEAVKGVYRFERTQEFSTGQMLAAITCYEYQTCEHDGWEGSDAQAFCRYLRESLCRKVPGYEGIWEIEERGNPPISLVRDGIRPNFEQTAAYFATALIHGQVEKGGELDFVASLIEQIRYLTQTDLPAVQRVIDRINRGGR